MTRGVGPEGVGVRLERLLLLLPWLYERREVPLAEAAARFAVTEEQLVRDLERIALCGVPPYIDEMIDVFIEDGTIHVGVPRLFTRPLRLTAEEGFSLHAAGAAAMALPGADRSGALGRALTKLARVLGHPVVAVDVPRPGFLDRVEHAARTGEVLAVRYWSGSSGTSAVRQVVPCYVAADRGHWYLRALVDGDHPRWLRVDRMESVEPTGTHVAPWSGPPDPPDWIEEFADDRLVTLRVPPEGAWVAERYPVAATRALPGGDRELDLPVASTRWLERLLLRLGPSARVLAPEDLVSLGARAAARVLERYG